jgi:hypothetical protein
VFLLSVVLSGLSGWFNLQLAPRCRVAYKELFYRLGVEQPTRLLAENQFIKDFPGYILYIGSAEGNTLKHVVVYQMETNRPPKLTEDTNLTPHRVTETNLAPESVMETNLAPDLVTGANSAPNLVAETNPAPDLVAMTQPATQIPKVELVLTAPEATVSVDPTNQQVRLFFPEVEGVYRDSWQLGGAQDRELLLPVRFTSPRRSTLKLSQMTFGQLLQEYYDYQGRGVDTTPIAGKPVRGWLWPWCWCWSTTASSSWGKPGKRARSASLTWCFGFRISSSRSWGPPCSGASTVAGERTPGGQFLWEPGGASSMFSNSTSKIKTALGPMAAPAPRSP